MCQFEICGRSKLAGTVQLPKAATLAYRLTLGPWILNESVDVGRPKCSVQSLVEGPAASTKKRSESADAKRSMVAGHLPVDVSAGQPKLLTAALLALCFAFAAASAVWAIEVTAHSGFNGRPDLVGQLALR